MTEKKMIKVKVAKIGEVKTVEVEPGTSVCKLLLSQHINNTASIQINGKSVEDGQVLNNNDILTVAIPVQGGDRS